MKIISVFGSSRPQPGSKAFDVAYTVGRLLAEAGFGVATGGYGGTMAAVSQGASEAGGHVIGVTAAVFDAFRPEGANPWVKEEIKHDSLRDRLMYLIMHNDGMITLPGGIGTLSEMTLAWSLMSVGEISRRPFSLLGEMWPPTVDAFRRDEYVSQSHLDFLHYADGGETAVAHIVESFNLTG